MVASRALHSHDVSSDGDDDDDYGMMMVMINKQTKITMSPFYQMWGNHDLYQDRVWPCYVFDNSDEKLDCSSGLYLGNKTMIIWGVSQKALI